MQSRLTDVIVDLHSDEIVKDSRGTEYSLFLMLNNGVRGHVILPTKPGGVLRFEIGNRVIYTRRVEHPGIAPRSYLTKALPVIGHYFKSQSDRISREIVAGTFDAKAFFTEVMEQVKQALIVQVPGRLKSSFRIEAT